MYGNIQPNWNGFSILCILKWHFRVTAKNIKIQDFKNKVSEVLMYTKY